MEIVIDNNKIKLKEKIISFNNSIESVLQFEEYIVVLLMNDIIPDNNVEAFDYNGNKIWNISDIIKLEYSEAYVSICKGTDNSFGITSYNGITYVIDTKTNNVIDKSVSK